MKQFLIKSFVFLLPLAFLLCALDHVITAGLKKTAYGDFAEWNELFNGRINADIIISGSSLAWVQISPRIVDAKTKCNSYNLGIDGSSFQLQDSRYRVYEKYNRQPRVIIQTIDPGTLQKAADLYNYQQFLPYLDEPLVSDAILSYNGLSAKDKAIPFHRYLGEYRLAAVGIAEYFELARFSNEKYKGYEGIVRAPNYAGLERLREKGVTVTIRVEEESLKLFESFLDHCRKSGIKLYLVRPPMYFENRSNIANYQELVDFYKNLAEKYNASFLDYSESQISYQKDIFYDGVHLTKLGSELFTEQLMKDLTDNYGLQNCGDDTE